MRTLLFAALAALAFPFTGQAQQPDGFACFENLAVPEYPKAALENRVDGSVWTTVQLNPRGAVENVETEVVSALSDGQKFLSPPVEKALRAAIAKPGCAGRKVSLVFRYVLHGAPTAKPLVTSSTAPPNIMYIESQPLTEETDDLAPLKLPLQSHDGEGVVGAGFSRAGR